MIPSEAGIYRIRNLLTARLYVGSAVNMAKRWGIHLHQLRHKKHHSRKLQRAWDQAGESYFVFEVIEIVVEPRDLLVREQFWIDSEDSFKRGYNCAPIAGSNLGVRFSQKARENMAAASRRRPPPTDETRRKMSLARVGKVLSAAHRAGLALRNRERGASMTAARLKRESEAAASRIAQALVIAPPPSNRTCARCEKKFYAKPSEVVRGGKYCSPACYHASQIRLNFSRTCRKCGESFSFPREQDHRYCPPCAVRLSRSRQDICGDERSVIWSEPLPPELRGTRAQAKAMGRGNVDSDGVIQEATA